MSKFETAEMLDIRYNESATRDYSTNQFKAILMNIGACADGGETIAQRHPCPPQNAYLF
jgi:hypothetical protein